MANECKHEWKYFDDQNMHMCVKCSIDELEYTKNELAKAEKERDQLESQVNKYKLFCENQHLAFKDTYDSLMEQMAYATVLRGALQSAMSHISHYEPHEPAMKEEVVAVAEILTEIDKVLSATSKTNERIKG